MLKLKLKNRKNLLRIWIYFVLIQHLLEGIDATSPNDEKRFFLKAIGNAGLVLKKTPVSQTDSIDRISELIKHEVADIDLRVQAIYSLRRVCKEHTHRVSEPHLIVKMTIQESSFKDEPVSQFIKSSKPLKKCVSLFKRPASYWWISALYKPTLFHFITCW